MEGTRLCSKCGEIKELDQFLNDRVESNRKNPKRSFICHPCRWSYSQKYNKRKNRVQYTNLETDRRLRYKEEAIRLLGGKCTDCSGIFPTAVYDFHHLDPTVKEYSPAIALQSWSRVENEILNKCILLCANCHRIRHFVKEFPTETTKRESQGAEAPTMGEGQDS